MSISRSYHLNWLFISPFSNRPVCRARRFEKREHPSLSLDAVRDVIVLYVIEIFRVNVALQLRE